jgi:hypothetical protein
MKMDTKTKKKMVLKRLTNSINKEKIQSKNYNCGENIECYADDLTKIIWKKDNKGYNKGDDNPVYGSIKTDRCTILQSTDYHTLKDLINHYKETVYSNKFTYFYFTKDDIKTVTFNKKQFIAILRKFATLDKTSSKKGSKSKIRLTLSNNKLRKIELTMFSELF